MNAWKIVAPKTISMEQQDAVVKKGFVKVKVTKLGITSADMAVFDGNTKARLPIVPGRIAAGLVSEMGEDSTLRKGERVLLSPYARNEKGNLLFKGVGTDGYLADYVVVPENQVYVLPETISEEQAIFTEYIAVADSIIDKLDLSKEDYVVILGANALGLILAQLAIYYQAVPILVDKSESKLKRAANYGVYYCIDSSRQDAAARIRQITCGKMADCTVFECRSAQEPQLAFSLTKENGKVGIVGNDTFSAELSADIAAIMGRQLSVVGVNNGADNMDAAINLLANEVVNVNDIIDYRLDFFAAPEAFYKKDDLENACLKIIIDIK